MQRRITHRLPSYPLVLALVAATFAAASLSAECTVLRDGRDGSIDLELRLPDGENSVQCRRDISAPNVSWYRSMPETTVWLDGEYVHLDIYASGVVEVEIRIEESGATFDFVGLHRIQISDGAFAGSVASFGDVTIDPNPKAYSLLLSHNRERFMAQLPLATEAQADGSQLQEELDTAWGTKELVMTVRRILQPCWMTAWVTGDVAEPRFFHGDVAWFRTSDERVKEGMMVGTVGDTELAETFEFDEPPSRDAALDLAERLGLISAEEREEAATDPEEDAAPDEPDEEPETFSQWMQEELRPDEGEDGDNFGLNLVALDLDANPGTDAAAAAMLSSAFTLTLSAGLMDYGPDEDSGGAEIEFRPSLVQATVGLGDKGGNRIGFGLGSLSGAFATAGESGNFIVGFLVGELETKGPYTLEGVTDSPRKLKIGVLAKFAARRGAFSCTGR